MVGRIPVGLGPIAVTLSNDEKYLYTTSQVALPSWNWPLECKPEVQNPATPKPNHAKGAVVVVDEQHRFGVQQRLRLLRCWLFKLPRSPRVRACSICVKKYKVPSALPAGQHAVARENRRTLLSAGTAPVNVHVVGSGRNCRETIAWLRNTRVTHQHQANLLCWLGRHGL